MPAMRVSPARILTWAGTVTAVALTAHTAINLRALRTPRTDPPPVTERVSVLIPARNEAPRIADCLRSVLAQVGVPDLEVLVLDDCSHDATAAVVQRVAGEDPRVRLRDGHAPCPGWLGKPHACHQLAERATGEILVFVDADVRLSPDALAGAVDLLRGHGLALVSPQPRQIAVSPAERLVQPLLYWSVLTTLPLRVAERSPRSSFAAANGQLLVVDAAAYRAAGGHASVAGAVLDDIALARAVRAAGGRTTIVDGSRVATCRMYPDWPRLREGYTKSLWSAFGSPARAAGVVAGLGLAYLVPPVAAVRGSAVGGVGYLAGVTGRWLVARRAGDRRWPDALGHPASVALFGWLTARSVRGRRAGTLRWKGRDVVVDGGPAPDRGPRPDRAPGPDPGTACARSRECPPCRPGPRRPR